MVVVDDLIDSLMQVALGKVQQAFGFGQFSFQVRDYLFAGFNFTLAGNDLIGRRRPRHRHWYTYRCVKSVLDNDLDRHPKQKVDADRKSLTSL